MATIADKLTTIAGIKTDIRTAINGKGGSLTSGSPFSAYSAEISSLPSGGGYPPDWSEIGYTGAPQEILDGFSHAKTIYDNWDPTVTNLQNKFLNDTSLVYMPMVDTSRATNMYNMFSACKSLTIVPAFNTSACTNMDSMFNGCSSITTVPQFDTSSVTNMSSMFISCSKLTFIPALDSSKVTSMGHMFQNCSSLQKITSLDMDKCTSFGTMFGYGLSNLRFMLLKGLGTPSGTTSYADTNIFYSSNWGVDSTDIPDARQSLVDSLLTYSFDRAAAGYATCTIKLHSNSYNQLTPQELADIQAKGYNITT